VVTADSSPSLFEELLSHKRGRCQEMVALSGAQLLYTCKSRFRTRRNMAPLDYLTRWNVGNSFCCA